MLTPRTDRRRRHAGRGSPMRLILACLAQFALASNAGCAAHHDASADAESEALAEDGSDTNATESDGEATVTSLLVATSGRVAVGAPTAPGFYRPAGCLQVTRDDTAQTATYAFDRCTGPLGLASVSGKVNVAWSVD